MARNSLKLQRKFILFIALLLCGSCLVPAQTSEEEFRRVLRQKAGFSESELSDLDNGSAVIKFLPVINSREPIHNYKIITHYFFKKIIHDFIARKKTMWPAIHYLSP